MGAGLISLDVSITIRLFQNQVSSQRRRDRGGGLFYGESGDTDSP